MPLGGFGFGPVFVYESLALARRWQFYASRAFLVAAVLGAMGVIWLGDPAPAGPIRGNELAAVGRTMAIAIVGTQLALVLLIAPAALSGSVGVDRASGKLAHLLTTDLSAFEIIIGKYLARLLPVLAIVSAGLPVAALATLLGGSDPDGLMRAYFVTLAVAVLAASVTLLFSVWIEKPHEVMSLIILLWAVGMLGGPTLQHFGVYPIDWRAFHPFYLALAPFDVTGLGSWGNVLRFGFGSVLASALCVVAATASLRPSEVRGHGPRGASSRFGLGRVLFRPFDRFGRAWRRVFRWLPNPPMDANPVLWRDWHFRGQSRTTRLVWGVYWLASIAYLPVAIAQLLQVMKGVGFGIVDPFVAFGLAFQASIGYLLIAVASATALAAERSRGRFEVLLTTPLSSNAIVVGKLLALLRLVPLVAAPTVLLCLFGASHSGRTLAPILAVLLTFAYGAWAVALGVAMATLFQRLDRALTATIGLYLIPTVAWLFLLIAIWNDNNAEFRALGSPWFGPVYLLLLSVGEYRDVEQSVSACLSWSVLYAIGAVSLAGAAWSGFNARFGRIDERPRPPRRPPAEPIGHREERAAREAPVSEPFSGRSAL